MAPLKRIVIVGATSAMAEHCARLWLAEGPCEIHLWGRDADRLGRVARDLSARSPQAQIEVAAFDLLDTGAIQRALAGVEAKGAVDIALIAHGSLPDQAACQEDLATLRMALEVNATSPALFAEGFAGLFARQGHGTLGLIGSVAGDRGRRSNYAYGAAKGLLTRYAQGLQHRFAGSGIKVVLIKPGPTATPMTAHLTGGKLAPVEDVARAITQGITRGRPVVYAPKKWAVIMMIIRHLPRIIFNKMDI